VVGGRVGVGDPGPIRQPAGLGQDPLEQERERLRDRVVAEVAVLEREPGIGMGVVLGVARLVEQRVVIAAASDRGHHEVDLGRHAGRRAERPRRFRRPLVGVDGDVRLPGEIDPEPGEGVAERGDHPLGPIGAVEMDGTEEPG